MNACKCSIQAKIRIYTFLLKKIRLGHPGVIGHYVMTMGRCTEAKHVSERQSMAVRLDVSLKEN